MKNIILFILIALALSSFRTTNISVKNKDLNALCKSEKDARQLIESYRQRVLKGESMSELAMLYSEDPGSAKNGGRYDNVVKGIMVPEFEKVAFSLKPGEVSEVFETEFGLHFIKLLSINGESRNVQHILVTFN